MVAGCSTAQVRLKRNLSSHTEMYILHLVCKLLNWPLPLSEAVSTPRLCLERIMTPGSSYSGDMLPPIVLEVPSHFHRLLL